MRYKKSDIEAIVSAPVIDPKSAETAGDILVLFYKAVGWNGEDMLDVRKIRTSRAVYESLFLAMKDKCNDDSVGMRMVNYGPGVDDSIQRNKVYILKGWLDPED